MCVRMSTIVLRLIEMINNHLVVVDHYPAVGTLGYSSCSRMLQASISSLGSFIYLNNESPNFFEILYSSPGGILAGHTHQHKVFADTDDRGVVSFQSNAMPLPPYAP